MNITINPQLSMQMPLQSKKNVKFGNHSYDGEFERNAISGINKKKGIFNKLSMLSYFAGIGLLFCGISAVVKNVLDSYGRKQLEYNLYEQVTSPNSDKGVVITEGEKESSDNALKFYDEKCNKSIWAWKSLENSALRAKINKAIGHDSEEGLNISDTEKVNIEHYMNIVK